MYLIRDELFRLGEHAEITDESGQAVLHVDGKVFSLHNQLAVRDRFGTEVAEIRRKAVALSPTYRIKMRGEQVAEVRKRLGHPFGDRFTVEIAGSDELEVVGDLLDHEFTVQRGDEAVATISRRWVSLHDAYAVSVALGQDDFLILAIVLALDLADHGRRASVGMSFGRPGRLDSVAQRREAAQRRLSSSLRRAQLVDCALRILDEQLATRSLDDDDNPVRASARALLSVACDTPSFDMTLMPAGGEAGVRVQHTAFGLETHVFVATTTEGADPTAQASHPT